MRISDWSSDVCSSDLCKPLRNCRWIGCCAWARHCVATKPRRVKSTFGSRLSRSSVMESSRGQPRGVPGDGKRGAELWPDRPGSGEKHSCEQALTSRRSEEHTSELQPLLRLSYAVFCLKKKKTPNHTT